MQYGAKLITVAKPQNPVSEQFRTVKTNIDFTSVDHQIKALALHQLILVRVSQL